jgi:hypothetical protein
MHIQTHADLADFIETMLTMDGKTTWLVHVAGKLVYAQHIDGHDHAAALALATAYTDKHYHGVKFEHRPTKQLA